MSVVRKSLLTVVGTGTVAVASLGIGVILARSLSPDGFGQYALLASTASLLGTIGSLGLGGASIYFINKRNTDPGGTTTAVVRASLVIGLLLAVVVAVTVQYEPYFGPLSNGAAIAVAAFAFGLVVVPATMYLLMAAMRVTSFVVIQVTPSVVLVLGLVVLALTGTLTLGPALAAAAAGQLVAVAILLYLVREDLDWRRPFRWGELTPLLRYGAIVNLAHFTYQAGMDGGLFLVRLFTESFDAVAFYRVALRLASVVVMVVTAMGPLLFSKYAAAEGATRPRQVERTCRVFWVVIPAMVVALELVAQPLVMLLFGTAFEPAILVFRIMLLGIAARALVGPMLELFYSIGKPSWAVAVLGLNVFVMAGTMFLLVPALAAIGAAWSFVLANAVGLAAGYTLAAARCDVRVQHCFLVTGGDVRFVIAQLKGRTVGDS